MPSDPRRRQKKLERRAAKRKEKKHLIAREQSGGLVARLTTAARFPVLNSLVSEDVWEEGLGSALLSRAMSDGTVAVAIFLVDRFCLGVKDALVDVVNRLDYETNYLKRIRSDFETRDVPPEMLRKFVEQAIAYADELGLAPHPDYERAKLLFGDIDPGKSTEEFEFGKDGKPLFIAGPEDTPQRCRMILNTLLERLGPDGFEYIMPFPSESDEYLPEGLRPESS